MHVIIPAVTTKWSSVQTNKIPYKYRTSDLSTWIVSLVTKEILIAETRALSKVPRCSCNLSFSSDLLVELLQHKERIACKIRNHSLIAAIILMILWTSPISNKAGISELIQCH